MKEKINVAAFMHFSSGSKSIPLKNIRYIAGRPLAYWAIEAALNCPIVDKVYVSTDSDEIKNCVLKIVSKKLEVIKQSPFTATDTASSESLLIDFCNKFNPDHVISLQVTSPLTSSEDISNGWHKYIENKLDSLITVTRQKRFIWKEIDQGLCEPVNYDPFKRPTSQDLQGYLVENGAFYISSRENILKSNSRLSGNIGYYEMPEDTYLEIDDTSSLIIIENILKAREKANINHKISRIKMLAMDVDGVLTDNGILYGQDGNESKKFNAKDGKGIELIRNKGLRTAIITSESSKIVENRAKKLKIDFLYMKIDNKKSVLQEISKKTGISLSEIAYIGDDVNDLSAFEIVGLKACPADAEESIKQIVDIVLGRNGGQGAVRDLCNLLLLHSK